MYSRDYSMHFDFSNSSAYWCFCFFLDSAVIFFNTLTLCYCLYFNFYIFQIQNVVLLFYAVESRLDLST